MDLFSDLNAPQQEAVNTLSGPLLILAGAGSGKTRVVTFRIVNLINHGVDPHAILGLTFTNKAAHEMKERVKGLTHSHVTICTFHSLGVRILRESIDALGYGRDFTIYDEDDIEKVLKDTLSEFSVDAKTDLKVFRQLLTKAKNALISFEHADNKENSLFPQIYTRYQTKLKECNALDFDDLLFLTIRLFREHLSILEMYQQRWKYLLIDEYQDTNQAQYEMIQQLARKSHNVCVVGDPDQSIYSWRGANIHNILNFEKDYPNAKVIRLEQNYRSRTNILEAANAVIRNNYRRFEKALWSDLGPGDRIKLYSADDERGEASFVADRIRYHHEHQGVPLNQMVVFYRTNGQSRIFEDTFLKNRIPYVIVGGISFYQRKEIKDILAFLRMVHSGVDFVSFNRTINIPKRGIGEATISRIRQNAAGSNMPLFAYCEKLAEDPQTQTSIKLTSKQKNGLEDYVRVIKTLKRIQESCSLKELVQAAIEETGYLEYLTHDKETYDDRKDNLNSLIAKALEWEGSTPNPTLSSFLEELALHSTLDDVNPHQPHVNLMTIHNGKGLEFAVAFLVGMEQELFPHANSRNVPEGLEEERRLFYVGITRAKEVLYLSHAKSRFIWGTTRTPLLSRFIKEIPFEYIEKVKLSVQYSRPVYAHKRAVSEEISEEPFSDEIQGEGTEAHLAPGDAVFHKDFGVGVINSIAEGGMGPTYRIHFSKDNKERSIVARLTHLVKL